MHGAEHTSRPGRADRRGAILGITLVVVTLMSVMGSGLLALSAADGVEASKALSSVRAFWMAEAGVQRIIKRLSDDLYGNIGQTAMGLGCYEVTLFDTAEPPYAIAKGTAAGQQKRLRIELTFLASLYEEAVYAGNASGDEWTFDLRGTGNPIPYGSGERGGRDEVHGNIYANGDIALYADSSINPAIAPNTYGLAGDAQATGSVDAFDASTIAGLQNGGAPARSSPDLLVMHYETNNTHRVGQIFADAGVLSGRLPTDHDLYNLIVINPADRAAENASTAVDDYFFEPVNPDNYSATSKEAKTPLHLGDRRVYFVDGDVWFNSHDTFGFLMDGNVTIVATGDIHVSDNLKYADDQSLLGLVALGRHDEVTGDLIDGGNVRFGDPEFGTLYTVDAFMFAANDFLYNTYANTGLPGEPETGFQVYGNYAALNQIAVNRDWYTRASDGISRPAHYDAETGNWTDVLDAQILTAAETAGLRHYQMIIKYDERIRNQTTQPPGLPKGGGRIFGGVRDWSQLP